MNRYVHQVPFRKVYNANAAGTGATFDRPYLQISSMSPRRGSDSAQFRRPARRLARHARGVLSLNVQGRPLRVRPRQIDYTFNVGTNATPTPAPARG